MVNERYKKASTKNDIHNTFCVEQAILKYGQRHQASKKRYDRSGIVF